MKLLIDNSLPLISESFANLFTDIRYFDKSTQKISCNSDVIICRAHTKINDSFLNGHTTKLIATATSGSDHLDKNWLKSQNIEWIDAIGSNAQSVCDYVLHLLHHCKIKRSGNKVGIIGVGHVGSRVNEALQNLNFETIAYDPPREIREPNFISCRLDDLFECDIISIHVPLNNTGPHKTFQLINDNFLAKCKPCTLLINTSRGEVINETSLLNCQHLNFCLDVYQNEPEINPDLIKKCVVATPHIAGHAIEAKQRAVIMLSKKIHQFFGIKEHSIFLEHLLTTVPLPPQNHLKFSYDPLIETNQLKQNPSSEIFLSLRNQHVHRHELHYETRKN